MGELQELVRAALDAGSIVPQQISALLAEGERIGYERARAELGRTGLDRLQHLVDERHEVRFTPDLKSGVYLYVTRDSGTTVSYGVNVEDALWLMENHAASGGYDRQKHLAWYEQQHPAAENWPPYPRTPEDAARYIAQYEGRED